MGGARPLGREELLEAIRSAKRSLDVLSYPQMEMICRNYEGQMMQQLLTQSRVVADEPAPSASAVADLTFQPIESPNYRHGNTQASEKSERLSLMLNT